MILAGNANARHRLEFAERTEFPELLMNVLASHPWLGEIEQKLPVEAPPRASAFCCYLDTVIFYENPLRVIGGDYVEYGRCDTGIRLDDVFLSGGRQWLVTSGEVAWSKGAWHMVFKLRRLAPEREIVYRKVESDLC